MKNKHSIKETLLRGMIGLTVTVCLLSGIANAVVLYRDSADNMDTRLQENMTAYNHSVQNAISNYKTKVEAIAADSDITDPAKTQEERNAEMSQLAEKYGFAAVAVADANGKTSDNADVSKRDYFTQSMAGKTYVSSPLVKSTTHQTVLVVSAKITSGNYDGIVMATLLSDTFSKMIRDVSIGKSGYGFITDKKGTIVAHKNQQTVTNATNYINMAQKDSAYSGMASVIKNMKAGQTGLQTVKFNGNKLAVSYSKISNTDGWAIGVTAKTSEMLGNFYRAIGITAAITVLFIVLSILLAVRIAKPIADPITALVGRIEKLADGDIHSEVPQINSNNEIGALSRSFTKTVGTLKGYVGEISDVLSSLKNGDCTVETRQDYRGDFVAIRNSLEGIIGNLNGMFKKVRSSADQVAAGAEQVSNAAQSLSQGATEQASSIEELSASITEINDKTGKNAEGATHANTLSAEASRRMEEGRQQMRQMVSAMAAISDSSMQIQKIIKTIQDIAFQTNILSLNASVEAARAGEAGKGFAVVADEVKNLAGKSAAAARNTSELIENSLSAVRNGGEIANATEKSFNAILETSEKTGQLIGDIATSSNEQAASISEVMQGVEQISSVVQTNSATSEESAAASEELSSQAKVMKDTLAFLKLK
ncbi:MAG TPA: hypothetical protein DIV41_00085 [Ruminococcaceae bacterium]|nr:hypothetical protein [Oscillospiraceae bacterium]